MRLAGRSGPSLQPHCHPARRRAQRPTSSPRSRPLALSRLLWEIGTEGGEVVMLRSRLGVDSGQMSRMLRALEADGLVTVTASDADAAFGSRGSPRRVSRSGRSSTSGATSSPLRFSSRSTSVSATELVDRHADCGAAHRDLARRAARDRPRGAGRAALPARVRGRAQPPGAGPRVRSEQGLHRRAARGAAAPRCVRRGLPARRADRLRRREAPPGRGDRHQADVDRRVGARARPRPPAARAPRGSRAASTAPARPASRPATSWTEAIALYRSAGYVEVPPFNDEPFADRWFAKPLRDG